MLIKTHHSVSLDGFATTPDGRPAILAMPDFDPSKSHGIPEFIASCGAVAMGRTTFEPAVTNAWWPWPGKKVYVLSSRELPEGTPDHVIHVTGGPDALIERLRSDDIAGDVELLGGATLIRACWQRGAIDRLGFLLLPILFGEGLPLFPLEAGAAPAPLNLVASQAHPDGALELLYERQ